MKKLLLASVLLVGLSTVGFATETYSSNMADLESSYQELQAQEQAMLEARRAEAVSAQERLRGQQAILAQITKRETQIKKYEDYKFFRPEYRILRKKYAELKNDAEKEIRAQKKVVADLAPAKTTKKK